MYHGEKFNAITHLVGAILAIAGTVVRIPDGTGTLDGAPVAARSYRVTVANVAMDLAARASDGMSTAG